MTARGERDGMLAIGKFNHLEIKSITRTGAYLSSEAGEILLPIEYLPVDARPGDSLRVFIYPGSDGRLVATTLAPKVLLGEFAFLEVKDTGKYGAFLDWGLEKDILVPFSEQPERMMKGEKHIVRVYLDNSGRIAASAKIRKFMEEKNASLKEGDEVELMIYEFTDLGAKVIINNRYTGLLFRDELHGERAPGERLTGYVKKIRDDKKIDVTLRKSGSHEMAEAKAKILRALAANSGYLPLNDKSSPEMIAEVVRMSKKTFKKAVGGLYKEGLVVLTGAGLKLRQ
jgi:predicted RNA-binding protein (virulence factor B family)